MSDLKLQEGTRDFLINEEGDFEVISTTGELALQKVNIRLRTYRGEWFLDTNEGIPWIQELLNRKDNKVAVDNAIREAVINTEGITKILAYESEQKQGSNLYNVKVLIRADNGATETIILEV